MRRYPFVLAVMLSMSLMSLMSLLAGCSAPTNLKPTVDDGWTVYAESRINTPIDCQGGKVQLNGDRLDTHLTNQCQDVRIAGAHNDIQVDLAPGGGIEITGSHNDVFWHQPVPGAPPQLVDHGASNTFHPKS